VRLKGNKGVPDRLFVKKFQFLLVRLKAQFGMRFSIYKIISIPFGAIKRAMEIVENEGCGKFQFLLVRLKGLFDYGLSGLFCNFNSFWCD